MKSTTNKTKKSQNLVQCSDGQVAEIEVVYQPACGNRNKPRVGAPEDSVKYLLTGYDKNTIALQEQFVVLYLNRNNKVLGVYRASSGGMTSAIVDLRIVLSVALKIAATAFIMSHNHPSGSLQPSVNDMELTKKAKEAAKFMNLTLIDHIIFDSVGVEYLSFAEEGLL